MERVAHPQMQSLILFTQPSKLLLLRADHLETRERQMDERKHVCACQRPDGHADQNRCFSCCGGVCVSRKEKTVFLTSGSIKYAPLTFLARKKGVEVVPRPREAFRAAPSAPLRDKYSGDRNRAH